MEAGVQIFLKILFAFSQLKLSLTVLGIENIKLFPRLIGECFNSIEINQDLNHIFGKTPISQIWNQDRSQVLGSEVFLVVGGGSVIFTKSDLKDKKQEKLLGCSFFLKRKQLFMTTIKSICCTNVSNDVDERKI